MTTGNRPRPLSDLVPNVAKDIFGKKSLLFGKMLTEWQQIAGTEIASKTTPIDLKISNKSKDKTGILHLLVQPAYALEFSYQKSLLIERLNMFFGYSAVTDIKIIQNSEVLKQKEKRLPPSRRLTVKEQDGVDNLVNGIKENDLQEALKNLGKAILSRQKQTL